VSAAINTGGPAFPVNDLQSAHATAMAASIDIEDAAERERAYILARAEAVIGMTLRDYFAAQAMQGAFTPPIESTKGGKDYIAMHAYQMADAMLRARAAS